MFFLWSLPLLNHTSENPVGKLLSFSQSLGEGLGVVFFTLQSHTPPHTLMDVTLLCEFGSLNGGEQSILAVLPFLRNHGIQFQVFAPPQSPLTEAVAALGIESVPFAVEECSSLPERRERLTELLRWHPPMLLHANSLSMGRLAGPIAEMLGIPSVAHLRDIIRLSAASVADLNRHRMLLAVSEATRTFHVAQGIAADRCRVLSNGVDLRRFFPGPPTGFLHREFGIPPGAPLLGVIGQIGLRKGQDFLLDALRPLFAKRNDVHLLIVGRRWSEKEESVLFEEHLRTVAGVEPYRNRIHFTGVRQDVPELLRELTLLVHPAKQEPLGRVLLEAAASGVCVVASNVGGTAEVLTDCDSARLFERGDTDMLCNTVATLLDSPDERERMGIAARKRIETAFSAELCAERLLGIYKFVIRVGG